MEPSQRILAESWIDSHRFFLMRIAYLLGNIVFMTKVEGIVLMYPILPFIILFAVTVTCMALLFTISITNITTIIPFFILAATVGALDGSMFAAFLFHAVTTTDLPKQMRLIF